MLSAKENEIDKLTDEIKDYENKAFEIGEQLHKLQVKTVRVYFTFFDFCFKDFTLNLKFFFINTNLKKLGLRKTLFA